MLPGHNSRLAGCGLSSDVLRVAEHDISLQFKLQVLNPNAGITGDEKLRAATRKIKKNMVEE